MEKLRTVLIDDENHCLKILNWELAEIFEVEVVGVFSSPQEALKQLYKIDPDLVFLDIEMPGMSGFDFLEAAGGINFDVIFTTAYDQFALKAIKVHAADYLLKPIDPEELRRSVLEVVKRRSEGKKNDLSSLLEYLDIPPKSRPKSVALHTQDGVEFVKTEEIIYCKAEGSYARIFLKSSPPVFLSKTLKDLEGIFEDDRFLRVHNSFLINLDHIKKLVKSDGGFLIMDNDDTVKISRQKKDELLNRIF